MKPKNYLPVRTLFLSLILIASLLIQISAAPLGAGGAVAAQKSLDDGTGIREDVTIVLGQPRVYSTDVAKETEQETLKAVPTSDSPAVDPDLEKPETETPTSTRDRDWSVVMSQTFEGTFPSTGWSVFDADGTTNGEFYWDDDDYLPHGGYWSAWLANGGANGLDPAAYYYPNNARSWMVYGPFDLSNCTQADFEFYWWNRSEVNWDWFFWGASSDGVNFNGTQFSGDSGGWTWEDFNLSNYLGDSSVYLAFNFDSDASNVNDGAFVDDLILWCNVPPPATDEWTFMVYLAGDNNLEYAAIEDFMEMSSIGSSSNVNIVVQMDRVSGYDTTYGNWTDTRRFHITPGLTPAAANGTSIGEANMGSSNTLVSFVQWALTNYPANHYALVLWDHGSGWRFADETLVKGISYDDTSGGDGLDMPEIRSALNTLTNGGAWQFDIIGMDACLMAMIEVDNQLRPYAQVRVGSEETEPGDGWPYELSLPGLVANPTWSASSFGARIVDDYYASYGNGQTQSAVHLSASGYYDSLNAAVDNFANVLIANYGSYATQIQAARNNSQEFFYTDYVDLYDFADEVNVRVNNTTIDNAATAVKNALNNVVFREHHGTSWPGAKGISIYYPKTAAEYDNRYDGSSGFLQFTANNHWDEWIHAYHNPVPTPTLTVNKTGTGSGVVTSNPAGINCGSDCSEAYTSGTQVTLTATAAGGSTFTGWSGGGCSGAGTCIVNVTANLTVTANFNAAPPVDNLLGNASFEIDANNDTRPDVWTTSSKFTRSNAIAAMDGSDVGRFYVTDNTSPTIQQVVQNISAGGNYDFSGWVNIPATSDAFTFKLQVRWRNASNGVISTSVVKTYTASTGGWNEAAASLTAPAGTTNAVVQMAVSNLNATIYVDKFLFKSSSGPSTYTLTVTKTGNGSGFVSSNPAGISCGSVCSYTFPAGTYITLTAAADAGSSFTGWSGGTCSGTNASCGFSLTANTSVNAGFTLSGGTPDLVIQSITPTPAGPPTNQPVTFSVVIKNQGLADASGFWVDLYIDTPAPTVCSVPGEIYQNVGSLAAGASQTLTLNYPGFAAAGMHTINGKIDTDCQVNEGNENNNTQSINMTVGDDLIFANGFESGNFSQWSSSTIDGGDLSVLPEAKYAGTYGMRALIDDNISIYVTDTTPNAESHYRVRFYFDPNSISMANGNLNRIFYGYSGTSKVVLRIEFRRYNNAYQIRAGALNDASSWKNSSWFTIADTWHSLELDWQAATGVGANNGSLTVFIDGGQLQVITAVDNDTFRIDQIRLGAVNGIDSYTRGTLYFDLFESRRQNYIGP